MRMLKSLIFLVAVLSFMVFFGHKETLTPEESLAINEFETKIAIQQQSPVASEEPIPGNTPTPTTTTPAPTPPAATAAVPTPQLPNGTVLEDSVNVRSGPGLDFPVVTQLYKGDPVILGDNLNGWYELQIDDRTYYISADWVTLTPIQ